MSDRRRHKFQFLSLGEYRMWSSLENIAVDRNKRKGGRLHLLPYCHQWIIWHDDKSFLMAPIIELLRILNVCWVFWRQQPAVAVISQPSSSNPFTPRFIHYFTPSSSLIAQLHRPISKISRLVNLFTHADIQWYSFVVVIK